MAKMISTMDVISRRPHGARHRRRLEAATSGGVRVRVPRDAATGSRPRRPPRGHHPDAASRARATRRSRARTRTSPTPSTCQSRSSSRECRSWSAGTAERDVAPRREACRRAERGRHVAGGRRGGPAGHRRPVRGDRPGPATLPVSVHLWWRSPGVRDAGQQRVDLLGRYADVGVSRVMGLMRDATQGDEAVEAFAADARAAGVAMAEPVAA